MEELKSILLVNEEDSVRAPTADQKIRIKEELKKEAKEIRTLKRDCKDTQRGLREDKRVYQDEVVFASWKWRHKHLAYCLLRGRKYEEIERKCHGHNKPNFKMVEELKEEFLNG